MTVVGEYRGMCAAQSGPFTFTVPKVTWSRRPPDGETCVRSMGPLGRVCAIRRRCVGSTPPSINDARRVEATGRNHRQTVASPSPNTIDRRSPRWPTRRALSSVRRTFAFARRVRRCRRRSGRIRIRLLPEVGKRRKQSTLLARCVTFETISSPNRFRTASCEPGSMSRTYNTACVAWNVV